MPAVDGARVSHNGVEHFRKSSSSYLFLALMPADPAVVGVAYLFILILLGYNLIPPVRGRRASTPRKERRRKGIEVERVKPPTPSQTLAALIGDEEQNGKQKKVGP